MPRSYVTDLTDVLDEDGNPTGEMPLQIALLVEVGSLLRVGDETLALALCVGRPRRRCGGPIVTMRPSHGAITWKCARCADHGIITQWHGSRFDLTDAPSGVHTDRSAYTVVRFSELWAMRRLGGGDADLRARLATADNEAEDYFVFSAEHHHLEQLRDLATAAADRARGDDRRLLDRFAARIDAFRTTLPEYTGPDPVPAPSDRLPLQIVMLAREIAAEHGRDDVQPEDAMQAQEAWNRGRRPLLH